MLVALKKNLNGSQFYKDLFGYFNNARWMSGGKSRFKYYLQQ